MPVGTSGCTVTVSVFVSSLWLLHFQTKSLPWLHLRYFFHPKHRGWSRRIQSVPPKAESQGNSGGGLEGTVAQQYARVCVCSHTHRLCCLSQATGDQHSHWGMGEGGTAVPRLTSAVPPMPTPAGGGASCAPQGPHRKRKPLSCAFPSPFCDAPSRITVGQADIRFNLTWSLTSVFWDGFKCTLLNGMALGNMGITLDSPPSPTSTSKSYGPP